MSRTELELILPSGFRFHPTDEELVADYLCRKCTGRPISAPIIAEIDLYRYDPWQLPELAVYGEKEWYFFSPRDRKYPNGCRPNRAAGSGYWKATGVDKPVGKPKPLGIKKALVFYSGKAPKGIKTNWIMHEYRLANVDRSAGRNTSLRLDDWVLCRIYNKKGSAIPKEYTTDQKASATNAHYYNNDKDRVDRRPTVTNSLQTTQHYNTSAPLIRQANYGTRMAPSNFFRPPSTPTPPHPPPPSASVGVKNDMFNFDPSDSSIPRHQNTESSGSEHVLSTSELSNCDREVQSQRQMNGLDFGFNSMGCDPFDAAPYQVKFEHDMEGSLPLEDIFMYLR